MNYLCKQGKIEITIIFKTKTIVQFVSNLQINK